MINKKLANYWERQRAERLSTRLRTRRPRSQSLASAPRSVISTDANEAVYTHGRRGPRGHG